MLLLLLLYTFQMLNPPASDNAGGFGRSVDQVSEQLEEPRLGDMPAFHGVRILDLKIQHDGAKFELDFEQPTNSADAAQQVTEYDKLYK